MRGRDFTAQSPCFSKQSVGGLIWRSDNYTDRNKEPQEDECLPRNGRLMVYASCSLLETSMQGNVRLSFAPLTGQQSRWTIGANMQDTVPMLPYRGSPHVPSSTRVTAVHSSAALTFPLLLPCPSRSIFSLFSPFTSPFSPAGLALSSSLSVIKSSLSSPRPAAAGIFSGKSSAKTQGKTQMGPDSASHGHLLSLHFRDILTGVSGTS